MSVFMTRCQAGGQERRGGSQSQPPWLKQARDSTARLLQAMAKVFTADSHVHWATKQKMRSRRRVVVGWWETGGKKNGLSQQIFLWRKIFKYFPSGHYFPSFCHHANWFYPILHHLLPCRDLHTHLQVTGYSAVQYKYTSLKLNLLRLNPKSHQNTFVQHMLPS